MLDQQHQTETPGVNEAAVAGQPGQAIATQTMPPNPAAAQLVAGQPQPDPMGPPAQTGDPAQVGGQPGAGQPHEEAIPYDRFAQVNDQRQQLASQNQLLQQQVALYQANMPGMGQPQVNQPSAQPNRLQEAIESLEQIGDDEQLYGKEARQAIGALAETIGQMQSQVSQSQFLAMNPDYFQVVGQGNQIAPALQHAINQNPMILQQIHMNPDPMAAALYFGRWGQEQLQKQQQAQQGLQTPPAQFAGGAALNMPPQLPGAPGPNNLTPAMSGIGPHSVANASTGTGLNDVNRYAGMTDEQFQAERQAILTQQRR